MAGRAIPHVLHYCWFGGAQPSELERRCIRSWSQVMPGWEIVRWDESNYDVRRCRFSRAAYDSGAWAFVSDCARFHILYEHGGILLDTDVELLRPLDALCAHEAFVGFMRNERYVNPGLGMGSVPGSGVMDVIARAYESLEYDGRLPRNMLPTSPRVTSSLLEERYALRRDGSHQELEGITVYPSRSFDPLDARTGHMALAEDTFSIHHYAGSWLSPARKYRLDLRKRLASRMGPRASWLISSVASVLRYGRDAFR